MKLSKRDKHNIGVNLLSDYLLNFEFEHLVLSSDKHFDIYIPSSETRIKVFCNFSNSKSLKVSNNFETENGILYLVVKPTRKNVHGLSCVGGIKSVIDKSIKKFDSKGSPKNIQIDLLKPLSVSKFIKNDKHVKEEKEDVLPTNTVFKVLKPNIKHCCVNQRRRLVNNPFIPHFCISNQDLNL
jgi:hypothetical protein